MAWVGVGVAGVGLVGSLVGGQMAAGAAKGQTRAQIEAARENRTFDQMNMNQGMARQLAALIGGKEAYKLLSSTMGEEQVRQLFRTTDQTAHRKGLQDESDQVKATLAKYGKPGKYDRRRAAADGIDIDALKIQDRELTKTIKNDKTPKDALDLGGFQEVEGSLGGYDKLATDAEQQGRDAAAGYDQSTDTIVRSTDDSLAAAGRYGEKRRDTVNRNIDRAQTGSNRLIQQSLMSRGLGSSTLVGNQLAGNTAQLEDNRAGQLGAIDDAQMSMLNQLRGQRTGMIATRLAGRSAMQLGNQDRVLGYRQRPIDLRTNLLSSSMLTPWTGKATGGYFPGVSPGAAGQATWGNTLGAVGGSLMAGGAAYAAAQSSTPPPNNFGGPAPGTPGGAMGPPAPPGLRG